MCDIGFDLEPCEIWQETERTARKQHKCSCCAKTIEKGEKYHTHFSKCDGNIEQAKICSQCFTDRAEFSKAHDSLTPVPGYFPRMLADCIAEGDEESETKWKPILDRINASRMAPKH